MSSDNDTLVVIRQNEAQTNLAQWQRDAAMLERSASALDTLQAARDEYNPRRRELAWSTSRHRMSLLAGILCSAAVGFLVGVAEAIGLALGRAVARRPLIVFPALGIFTFGLVVQTMRYVGPFSWDVLGEFVEWSVWWTLIAFLAAALMYGIYRHFRR